MDKKLSEQIDEYIKQIYKDGEKYYVEKRRFTFEELRELYKKRNNKSNSR